MMRNAFIDELVIQASINDRIFLIVGDLGYSVIEPFVERFPNRFINAGIAEQNMMGLAAGLASEGWQVFVYSIANFPTFRCAEQIRNDVAYHNLPVTIVSVGGGVAYGNLGYSHHAVQDYGLIRSMPGMIIASPGDPLEVRACLKHLVLNPQPSYLRLGKAGEKNINETLPTITPGVWNEISAIMPKPKYAVLTTGNGLQIAAAWIREGNYIGYDFYSLPIWGMDLKYLQPDQVRQYEKIITVEDHLVDCGFGSWILESLSNHPELISKIHVRALNAKVCNFVAGQEKLHELGYK